LTVSPALTVGTVKFPELVPILKLVGPKDCETVNATGELYTPDTAAVILVVPAVKPVAEPLEPILAIPELLLFQDTMELIFADELSE
jgi:hypothetical protein